MRDAGCAGAHAPVDVAMIGFGAIGGSGIPLGRHRSGGARITRDRTGASYASVREVVGSTVDVVASVSALS